MKNCRICESTNLFKKFEYFKIPKGETVYPGINYEKYHRIYFKCKVCKHYSSYLKMKIDNHYSSTYNKTVYSGNLKKNFEKINNLPSFQSDNFYRVKRIDDYLNKNNFNKKKLKILDVGSGLGIFPYKMSKKNYDVTALDPDKKSCLHIRKNLKIQTLHGDFFKLRIKKRYNLITLNKVIEHVASPKKMLIKIKKILKKKGLIYIEVPDERASLYGKDREEFHIDHLHVFSKNSLNYLTNKINLKTKFLKSIKEPSGKYTIFGIFSI